MAAERMSIDDFTRQLIERVSSDPRTFFASDVIAWAAALDAADASRVKESLLAIADERVISDWWGQVERRRSPSPKPRAVIPAGAASHAFLEMWFALAQPGELVEVRPLNKKPGAFPMSRTWFGTATEAAAYVAASCAAGDDVYIGALPRSRRAGTSDAVGSLCWLWADVDYGTVGHAVPSHFATRDEALAAISAFSPAPSLLIDTAGGFHVWWALEAIPDAGEWTSAMRRIAFALDGDTNAIDPPRILRIPGTYNYKTKPARAVVVVTADGPTTTIAAFASLPEPPVDERETEAYAPSASPRQVGGDRPFDRANDVPIAEVLSWLNVKMHRESRRIYCACPVHRGHNESQCIVGGSKYNTIRCFGDCSKSFSPVDVAVSVLGVEPMAAVDQMADRFGFEGFKQRPTPAPKAKVIKLLPAANQDSEPPAPLTGAPPPTNSGPLWTFQRGDQVEIASVVLGHLGPSPLTHDEGDFWRYSTGRGVWERLPIQLVEHTASLFAGSPVNAGDNTRALKVSSGTVKGAAHIAQNDLVSRPDRLAFASARRCVAFRNGVAVVDGGEVKLLPHSPEHGCRYAFDFDYEPDPKTPLADEFFDLVFGDVNEEERGRRVSLLQEFAGVSLIGEATAYQTCLVLFGPGGNGKSEALRILRGLFPPGAVVSLPPQKWGERFQIARLVGALANFVDEVPEREVTSGETFKSIISGEPTHAERKNRDPFDFTPIAGHIFSANTPFGTSDQSDGYWRRFAVCPFTHNIERHPARRPYAGLAVLRQELPSLVSWALQGGAKAQRGGFTQSDEGRRAVMQWRDESDPVRMFMHDRQPLERSSAANLYEWYCRWCKDNGHVHLSSVRFSRRLLATGHYKREHAREGNYYTKLCRSEPCNGEHLA
jgi:P4 family phage/plasmid primase-like protien